MRVPRYIDELMIEQDIDINSSLEAESLENLIVPLPSRSFFPAGRQVLPLSPLLISEEHLAKILNQLLTRAGLSVNGAARLLSLHEESVRGYTSGRRANPSLLMFARFVDLCGGKLLLELPDKANRR